TQDLLGNILTTTIPDPDGASRPLGNLITNYAYWDGVLASMRDARGYLIKYGYDAQHRLINVIHPDKSFTDTTYDAAGNIVVQEDELRRATHFVYDSMGRKIQTIFADGSFARTRYDGRGRVVAEIEPAPGTTVSAYGLDPVVERIHTYQASSD